IHHRHQAAVKHFFCPSKFCNARARQDPVAQDSIRQAPSPTSTTTDGSPAVSASPCDGRAGLPCAASGSCRLRILVESIPRIRRRPGDERQPVVAMDEPQELVLLLGRVFADALYLDGQKSTVSELPDDVRASDEAEADVAATLLHHAAVHPLGPCDARVIG